MSSEPKNIMTMAELLRAAKIKREQEERDALGEAIPSSTIVSDTIPNPTIPASIIPPAESKQINRKKTTMPRPTIVRKTIAEDIDSQATVSPTTIPSDTIPPRTTPPGMAIDVSRGYFQFLNDLSDRIIPAMGLKPFEQVVLTRLYRLSRGWQSEECTVGLGALSKQCVMSRTSVQKTISVLVAKGLITDLGEDKKGGKEGKRYRVLPGLTMPQRTIVNDTILKDERSMLSDTTEVRSTIPRATTNKDINKDLKNNTHTGADGGVGVGSKFTLEECQKYAVHLQQTGQGINNPGGYATTIHRSGEADPMIENFLRPRAGDSAANLDAARCPDCHGTGFYYPRGPEAGVARCRHEKLGEEGAGKTSPDALVAPEDLEMFREAGGKFEGEV